MSDNFDKTIWITGASSGIGKATASKFHSRGYNIIISSRQQRKLENFAKEISNSTSKIHVFPCDFSISSEIDSTSSKIFSQFNVDCLVNNAAITSFKTAEQTTSDEIKNILNTNLLGAIFAIKNALPYMIKNGGGTIVNVLSVVTHKTFTNSSVYSASKMGLLGFSNSLREEVRKHNIRVINISPGATDTSMWSEKVRSEKSQMMIRPEEVADVILWAYEQNEKLVTEEILIRPITGDL